MPEPSTSRPRVAVIAGSLREESISRALASALVTLGSQQLEAELVGIADLPLYNPDLEGEREPTPWGAFRAAIASAEGVLIVTPEYNRSIPGCLKNAIDVGSRPRGTGALNGKPAAVISLSQGALGGVAANLAVRQSLVTLGMPVLAQPEAYLSHADRLLASDGSFQDESTATFMLELLEAFASWIRLVGSGGA